MILLKRDAASIWAIMIFIAVCLKRVTVLTTYCLSSGKYCVSKKTSDFSAHAYFWKKIWQCTINLNPGKWLIYKIMSVLSDLVVSNVEAYKTRRLQSNSKRKTCTESSIPPLRNHVFFIKIRLRLLCSSGLAKYATNNNTPGTQ